MSNLFNFVRDGGIIMVPLLLLSLGAALGAILKHRDRPVSVAERQVEDVGQDYFIRLERLLPFLDTTTTISPSHS